MLENSLRFLLDVSLLEIRWTVSNDFVLLLAVVTNRDGSCRAVDDLAPDCLLPDIPWPFCLVKDRFDVLHGSRRLLGLTPVH